MYATIALGVVAKWKSHRRDGEGVVGNMKAYKLEVLVLDFEESGDDEVKGLIENNRYLMVDVITLKSKQIDDWDDDHPLNNTETQKEAFERMFA